MSNLKRIITLFIFVTILGVLGFYYFTNVYGYKTYLIQENDKEVIRVKSKASTVKEILKEQNIEFKETDLINPPIDVKVEDLDTINITRAKEIVFKNGKKEDKFTTTSKSVADFIKERNVELSKDDIINVSLKSELEDGMLIRIDYIKYEEEVKYEDIDFKKVEKKSDKLEKGKTNIIVVGQKGVREIKTVKKYLNSDLVDTYTKSDNLIKEPVTQEILIGTKKKVVEPVKKETDKNKVTTKTTKKKTEVKTKKTAVKKKETKKVEKKPKTKEGEYIVMEATAYSIKGETASGVMSGPGKVAVDPNVIPLGTRLKIVSMDSWPSYGYAVAADTGGAIKGKRIDLFYTSNEKCLDFGRRKVKVYILK